MDNFALCKEKEEWITYLVMVEARLRSLVVRLVGLLISCTVELETAVLDVATRVEVWLRSAAGCCSECGMKISLDGLIHGCLLLEC